MYIVILKTKTTSQRRFHKNIFMYFEVCKWNQLRKLQILLQHVPWRWGRKGKCLIPISAWTDGVMNVGVCGQWRLSVYQEALEFTVLKTASYFACFLYCVATYPLLCPLVSNSLVDLKCLLWSRHFWGFSFKTFCVHWDQMGLITVYI